ncbi:DUF5719 family protein [Nocardioides sp. Soil805]|uniref:DUF5719 family protein n=1 Tax=Nocardioides sp. Soil805 TaxID=1736416 RepID=UPI0007028301|nr:DUF5719 family protein [Nocardioides sp. Soil805]KRF29383.1 hypothetical protein ASG94_20570 [Nocardioides sp. Soil805]
MTEPAPTPQAGRRAALPGRTRRLGPLDLLAVLIPLVTVGTLLLVRPVSDDATSRPPAEVALTRTTLVCPAALPGAGTVAVASATGERGEVEMRQPAEDTLTLDGTVRDATRRPVVLQAEGTLAAGLVAGRYGDGAATSCDLPSPEQWFTGVGASAEHASVLEVTNPDRGPAVADVTVLGPDGPVDVPAMRGVTVPGGRTVRFDLAQVVPDRADLSLRVVVSRGRLGVHVVDQVDELGAGPSSSDWLPPQAAPATTSYLVGLGGKPGDRVLAVANPGDDEVRVALRVVTKGSEFTPSGLEELTVPPGSTSTVDLTGVLRGKAARGAIGLRLEASQPVTAALRTLASGDLSLAVGATPFEDRAALTLPSGPARLVLAGAEEAGVVTYTLRDRRGREVARERVAVGPGVSPRVRLTSGATQLDLVVERTTVVAAVEVGPPGLAVLPLSPLRLQGLVADVRPALR